MLARAAVERTRRWPRSIVSPRRATITCGERARRPAARACGLRPPVRGARAARLHRRRADGARSGDRLRRDRLERQLPVGWTDEQDGGQYRLRGAATARCSATPSARTRGSGTSCRRASRSGARAGPATAADRLDRDDRRGAAATRSSARARASCRRSGILDRVCSAAPMSTRLASAAPGRVRDRGACGQAGGTCFCVSMDTGPAPSGIRPRADRGYRRRRHHFLVEVGTERGAERAARAAAAAAAAERTSALPRTVRARPRQMGRELDIDRHQGPALSQLRAPALERGRRALPDLRQLHHGLPDLLLHDRRGRHRPLRRARRAPPALGFVLHGRLLLHPRRRRPRLGHARATASG